MVAIRSCLGMSSPNNLSEKFSTVLEDSIVVRDSDNEDIGSMYVGVKPEFTNQIVLPNGSLITEHQFHIMMGAKLTSDGVISNCRCEDCRKAITRLTEEQLDAIATSFIERPLLISVPEEDIVRAPSPEVNEKLPAAYRVTPITPSKIIKITRLSFETN